MNGQILSFIQSKLKIPKAEAPIKEHFKEEEIVNKPEDKYQDPAIKNLEVCVVKTSEKNIRTDYRYQRSKGDFGNLKCRIHGRHKQKDCKNNSCEFCGIKNNHRERDCLRKKETKKLNN